ncbi:MAG: hypothetical protein CL608_34335 [Anaerolineaceae bacterium]|nr:hypothetical protein [Anaerolineaceae bacterium]
MRRDEEDLAIERGKDRYHARWNNASRVGKETDTVAGRTLLRLSVSKVRDHLDEWLDRASTTAGRRHSALDVFRLVPDVDLLSLLLLRATLDGITKPRSFTNLALKVGTAVEQEYRLREADRLYPLLVASIKQAQFSHRADERRERWVLQGLKAIRNETIPRLPATLRLRAGAVALEIIERHSGLIEIVNESRGKKKLVKMVRASDELCAWLSEAHLSAELLKPLLPLLTHPPIPWSDPSTGGYIKLPLTLVKKSRAAIYEDMDAPTVYKAMNIHQSTGWEVNSKVLRVMEEAWDRGMEIGGLPSANLTPMPNKPLDIETNKDARKRYAIAAAEVRSLRNAEKSKRLHAARLLGLAQANEGKELWQPVTLDFRGRMYTAPTTLNSQSSDLAKSLLRFSEGMPMDTDATGDEGEQAFKSYGASLYGESGEMVARVHWVNAHHDEIMASAKSPLDGDGMFWAGAKKPWVFLSWAMEYAEHCEAKANGGTFHNHIPISIDATCNGCQIWSLLLEDLSTAMSTNVYPNESPRDLYGEVARGVLNEVTRVAIEGTGKEYKLARGWLKTGRISRSVVKPAVLILPYSGTLKGMAEAIRLASDRPLKSSACFFLAKQVKKVTEQLIPAVLQGREWCKEVSNICADHGVAVEWTLPTGFRVVNDYRTPKYKTVQTWMGDKYSVSTLAAPSKKLAKRRCAQTITANLTHSLDGAVAARCIEYAAAAGVSSFSVVFDSFGTHAVNLPKLGKSLLSAVDSIFNGRQNYLCQMREHLLTLLPEGVELPEPPIVGNFSTHQVCESRYFAS